MSLKMTLTYRAWLQPYAYEQVNQWPNEAAVCNPAATKEAMVATYPQHFNMNCLGVIMIASVSQ